MLLIEGEVYAIFIKIFIRRDVWPHKYGTAGAGR